MLFQEALQITVNGIVQGVGFRPFIYKKALEHNIKGWVINKTGRVVIHAEGERKSINSFIESIKTKAPPAAMIKSINKTKINYHGYNCFQIKTSEKDHSLSIFISPDLCICKECAEELRDINDRRYQYPFINCTNCGPRYTIIEDLPYDRASTTMKKFEMCPECSKEFSEPSSRRFHAQPNACPLCGPSITIKTRSGQTLYGDEALKKAKVLFLKGEIGAVKGIGGYNLACDAKNAASVKKLRVLKERNAKPFALMAENIDTIRSFCNVSSQEEKLLRSAPAPIVLLEKINELPEDVAGNSPRLGFMLPYTPLHILLMDNIGTVLVMTSGNISDQPLIADDEEAFEKLSQTADFFLFHNRPIFMRCDDSVTQIFEGHEYPLRRARGYAPSPLSIPFPAKRKVFAAGADLKGSICFLTEENAFISQHLGDIKYSFPLYDETYRHMKKLFRFTPDLIACDFHDEYISSKYASEINEAPVIKIQHHHAHFASCLAEYGFTDNAIGVIFDGQGLGSDGALWGGEIFSGSIQNISREIAFNYTGMPGGELAAREPWRMALGLMHDADESFSSEKLPFNTDFLSESDRKIIMHLIKKPSYLTSSAGRLFDAVSALIGLKTHNSYEGEAAILLENCADKNYTGKCYTFGFEEHENNFTRIRPEKMFLEIYNDILRKRNPCEIAAAFHHTMAAIVSEGCLKVRKKTGLSHVALSGGVFQNIYFLSLCKRLLKKNNFSVMIHRHLPPNDGCISFGQAVIAERR